MSTDSVLALIPARGGSKGLPGKNIRPLAGLPLIAHSIELAKHCPEISRIIVSTDSDQIASVAQQFGADVPFIRPHELASDDTPMWPVVRHALTAVEEQDHQAYDYLILLDPTSPGRTPEDISGALDKLHNSQTSVGIIGVSQPEFNPIWHCVIEQNGQMADLFDAAKKYNRRQDLPTVYRINAALYIWKAGFVRNEAHNWRESPHLLYEIPDHRAIHIDDIHEFERADILIKSGIIKMPWLTDGKS